MTPNVRDNRTASETRGAEKAHADRKPSALLSSSPTRRFGLAAAAFTTASVLAPLVLGQPRIPPIIRTPGRPVGGPVAQPGAATPAAPVAPPLPASALPTAVPPPPAAPAPFKAAEGTGGPTSPTAAEAALPPRPAGAGVTIGLQEADLSELVNWIGSLTGKRFIYGSKVRQIKVTLYSPQPVTVAEAYKAFLVALDTNGLTVIPQGRFLKIIESTGVVATTTPIYGTGQPVPAEERFVTRLYRLQHVGADEVNGVLQKFKSKDGDVTPYAAGNLLILTDTGSNIRRMLQIVEEIDVGTAGEGIWVEPIHYGLASEIATKVNEIFDIKAAAPGKAPAGDRITKVVADDRTNSLLIIGTERAYLRLLEVIKRLDVPKTGEGEIHVLALQHAMAEELGPVLNQILAGAAPAAGGRGAPAPAAAGALPQGILEGGVRITADKASNSLIITSSLRDYAQIRSVIDKLDHPRRQVFIEAVIMDISVNHTNKLGLNYHGGVAQKFDGKDGIIFGGLNPLTTILPPSADQLQGFALGVRGPGLDVSNNLLGTGLSIPAFGVILNALATSGDANVLATPHIIATDNVAAEISVGENIPLQTNAGGALGQLAGASGAAGALAGLGGLGALGGFGAAPRTDVGTKIKVTPHMNDSNEVRLELQEEISEQGATSGALGAVSITKRTANTSVVVQDQQTVVIGGLMRDAVTTSSRKIPLLGDIPVLGFLFRSTESSKRKTNLLLILTPYVIRDQNDLRSVFERKMQERQEFLDRYFVFSDEKDYEPPKDFQRLNGLLEDIRQSYLTVDERRRLAESTRPKERKTHEASGPIEMHEQGRGGGDTGTAPPAGNAPPAGTPPTTRPPRIRGGAGAPTLLAPGARTSPGAGDGGTPAVAPATPAPAPRRE